MYAHIADAILGAVPIGEMMRMQMTVRKQLGTTIASLVNEEVPHLSYKAGTSLFAEKVNDLLLRDGIVVIPDFMSPDYVERINAYFETKKMFQSHIPRHSKDLNFVDIDGARKARLNHASYDPGAMLAEDLFLPIFLSEIVHCIASLYLKCAPTFYSINAFRSFATRMAAPGVTTLHRDYDDYKFIAFFVYLTDVTEVTGAFSYVPGSQEISSGGSRVLVSGRKGTLVVADTFGLHQGLPPIAGDRFAIWWRYGLGKNAAYMNDGNSSYKFGESLRSAFDSDLTRYIYRLFR